MADDLLADLTLAIELVEVADTITTARFRATDLRVSTKPDLTPVTEADQAVEAELRRLLARARPSDAVVGEEEGATGASDGRRRWILDPIDGTKSYVRGMPAWATLLALEEDGELVLGVVSAPALGRRWWAARGHGAHTGDGPIAVSDVTNWADAQLCFADITEWDRWGITDAMVGLSRSCWRAIGCGDFWGHMLVAEGVAEAMVEPDLSLWDIAAVRAVVTEAGGRCTDLAGQPATGPGGGVSTNGHVHETVLRALDQP